MLFAGGWRARAKWAGDKINQCGLTGNEFIQLDAGKRSFDVDKTRLLCPSALLGGRIAQESSSCEAGQSHTGGPRLGS